MSHPLRIYWSASERSCEWDNPCQFVTTYCCSYKAINKPLPGDVWFEVFIEHRTGTKQDWWKRIHQVKVNWRCKFIVKHSINSEHKKKPRPTLRLLTSKDPEHFNLQLLLNLPSNNPVTTKIAWMSFVKWLKFTALTMKTGRSSYWITFFFFTIYSLIASCGR